MRRLLTAAAALVLITWGVAATAAPAAPSGYLVGSASPLTATQVDQLKAAGAQVHVAYRNFGGAAAAIPSSKVAAVRALPFVTSVSADPIRKLAALSDPAAAPLPNDPYWHDQMNLENVSQTGTGVWVAVLDSGFYPNWRDYFVESDILTDKARAFVGVLGNPNANQWDSGSDPHGMAVSATITGHRFADDTDEGGWGTGYATGSPGTRWIPGVAPGAKVIPVKVCEPIGCFGSAINAGVDYVTSLKKANPRQPIVINESLGGAGLDAVEKAALDAAVKAGVVVVASAGNEGDAGMGFPAAYEPVVSVGAGGWTRQWSDYPDKTWWLDDVPETGVSEVYVTGFSSRQKAGQYLDVVSEGRYLLLPYPCAQLYKDGQVASSTNVRTCASKATPDNASASPFQYLFMSGTSFSGPAVAGVVALMLERNPGLSNADAQFGTLTDPASWGPGELERRLEASATPLAPGSVTVTHRTGGPLVETWGADAIGHGWVFADDAVNAAG
ncbi:S8 family serine peptidase [Lentzea sp. BCCO 10_0856]|uniref:S8 family serine peptidase n=1 Tax=Lentzea miocenica TaxID=3095431 RepID=A0ABU4T847_9PSEU|nr:S8 family serine peptidase [Lentzea sp. BCCO 10_0856]MDX8034316.1 S8 family serine peptidase [Lentzea sp. BCCO 10_0856]